MCLPPESPNAEARTNERFPPAAIVLPRGAIRGVGECLRILSCLCLLIAAAQGQTPTAVAQAPDLTKQPTLYVVGYAHLDTEWRWEYPQVIREYLSKTMRNNFALFEKYPHYIFNFSGANRYRLMKEYYPSDYAALKRYVAAGRWFPAGSSMEESDVNSPSAESIFRQILYGNEYFRRDFGKASAEYMLPDCFGFPASLPSILAHSGIKGFSTQKLTWGSSAPVGGPDSPQRTPRGTPFNVGLWEGPDGKAVLAAFNPGDYSADITTDLSKPLPAASASPDVKHSQDDSFRRYQDDWAARVQRNGEVSGLFTDYHYYGTGDVGGAPTEASVKLLEATIAKREASLPQSESANPGQSPAKTVVGEGPVRVVSSTADQMFLDIKPSQFARLPHFKGELELTNHSAGSLTSEAYQKRWNRKNELLADAAEKASVAAAWLGVRPYPLARLNDAWTLVMGGQFHDIMAGTATPESYTYSWNDEVLAMNQFAGVLKSATAGVVSGMDTEAKGTAIIVYNPLNIPREDVVEAEIDFPEGTPKAVRVFDPDGKEVPAQLKGEHDGIAKVLFLAKAPSVGWVAYDVQPTDNPPSGADLKVSESSLENARYRIQLDENGDVSSLFDKSINRELLSAPARLAFQTEKPHDWPAWNMDWADQQKPPRGYVQGPARVRVVEHGPVRVAVKIERETEGSRFVQTIRLSAGDAGNRVEFDNLVDWKTKEAALKATFSLSARNALATYNWDVGTIERGSNTPEKFEVASHQWFDLTDQSGAYGVTVLSDCKYGSDKPDDHTLRLTLLYTPGLGGGVAYPDQTTQDWGHHEFVHGLTSHAGDWRDGQTDWQGYRLNQPLIAFQAAKHPGALGKEFSLLTIDNRRVRVLALKKAEQSDEVVVRLVELDRKPAKAHLSFATEVLAARELNGQEMPLGPAIISNGKLVADFTPFQLHTFAIKLAPPLQKLSPPHSKPVQLHYDTSVATLNGRPAQGCFDCSFDNPTAPQGSALPAEMLPASVDFGGIRFSLAPVGNGKPNAVTARGQVVDLPPGNFKRIYLLAAAAHGDQDATFLVDDQSVRLNIQEWTGAIGQWDHRTWESHLEPVPPDPGSPVPPPGTPPRMRRVAEFTGKITPGFIKRADVAWFASHRHAEDGSNEPYSYSYLYAYAIDLSPRAKKLTLPNNGDVHILAATVTDNAGETRPAQPLYDTLDLRRP